MVPFNEVGGGSTLPGTRNHCISRLEAPATSERLNELIMNSVGSGISSFLWILLRPCARSHPGPRQDNHRVGERAVLTRQRTDNTVGSGPQGSRWKRGSRHVNTRRKRRGTKPQTKRAKRLWIGSAWPSSNGKRPRIPPSYGESTPSS